MDEAILIVNFGNPVATDYARHCQCQGGRHVFVIAAHGRCEQMTNMMGRPSAERLSVNDCLRLLGSCSLSRMVLFLAGQWMSRHRKLLETVVGIARQKEVPRICVVSTWKVHFEERLAIRVENAVLRMLDGLAARVVILRPSHVLSPHSRLSHVLRMSWLLLPFVPLSLKGCSIAGEELFATIEQELSKTKPRKGRTYTLLGPNRPWRMLLENSTGKRNRYLLALTNILVPLTLFRLLLGWFFGLVAGRMPRLKEWHTETQASVPH